MKNKKHKMSGLEELVFRRISLTDLPTPEFEYRFHPVRKWRFDMAWPDLMVAIECEGGVFAAGRHTRGAGFVKDCEKYNQAVVLGWKILRVTARNVNSFMDDLEKLIKKSKGESHGDQDQESSE